MINYEEYQRYKNELENNPHISQDIYRRLKDLVREFEHNSMLLQPTSMLSPYFNQYGSYNNYRGDSFPNFPIVRKGDGIKSQINTPNKLLLLLL